MKPRRCLCLLTSLVIFSLQPAANADMLVSGFGADAVYRFDSSGASLGVFASHPTLMDGPAALVFNSSGNLLVLNEFSHNVLQFNGTSGAFISEFISPTTLGGAGVTDPDDMELGADGKLYVTSHFNDTANIFRFDSLTGAYLGVFAASLPIHHQHGLAFGPGGHLYQGNVASGLVERFNGITGAAMGNLTSFPVGPIGDLIFGTTSLYVACGSGGGLARFDAFSGALLGYLVPPGTNSFWGVTIDGGILYAANSTTGAIQKYDATTAAFLGDFIATGPGAFDLLAMPAPEPSSATLLMAGIAICAVARRSRQHRRAIC